MKSYTDIEQSKKLAEILPLESADGFWEYHDKWCSEGDEWEGYEDYPRAEPYLEYTRKENEWKKDKSDVPCWSLTALLEFLRNRHDCNYVALTSNKASLWCLRTSYYNHVWEDAEEVSENAVDACVEMIIRFNELKML